MMVVAANKQAAQVGLDILKAGGSAMDAAVGVQAVLGLVEPQASGLGGGAMLLYYDAATTTVTAYDGRETAPASATPGLFIDADSKPMGFTQAAIGGRAVGVPGTIPVLQMAYKAHGRLSWADLFKPAIALADQGFPVSPRLAALITHDADAIAAQKPLRDLLLANGPPTPGTILKNPAYADTLRQIAALGSTALQTGPIAADIAAAIRGSTNPGLMTADDLAAYRPIRREPVCGPYRANTVCSTPSPSAGGTAIIQTLGMLSHFDLPALKPQSADAAMLLLETERLAMADRDAFGADADRVRVPQAGLIADDYLTYRAQLIDPDRAMIAAHAGNPSWNGQTPGEKPPPQPAQPEHGTSDVAIVDSHGNAVSMTTTIEGEFGAHLLVHGFLLNNELTDFAFVPEAGGRPLANRVQPGKRPRSAMAPAIVLDSKRHLVAVAGSAGGARIPGYVVQALVGVLDWSLDPEAALSLGHVGVASGPELEDATQAAGLLGLLRARGETVAPAQMASGSALILVTPKGLAGAADPRRDGFVAAD